MITKTKVLTLFVSLLTVISLNFNFAAEPSFSAAVKTYKPANAIEMVNNPQAYVNQSIKITADFDKFSTLGLDYKPAFRDSKKYISFLIKRPDVQNTVIPLSELKLIILREKAEKLIDLETGDKIEINGTVFSTALNDPWVDVDSIKVLSSKTVKAADIKADNASQEKSK